MHFGPLLVKSIIATDIYIFILIDIELEFEMRNLTLQVMDVKHNYDSSHIQT